MNNALLAQLSIRMLGNRHKDASLTEDVHERHGMSQDAGLYQKCVLPESCLAPLRKVMNAARADHRSQTLMTPYGPLLPTPRVEHYSRAMDAWKSQWAAAVTRFVRDYDKNIDLARIRLNGSFNPEDYPPKSKLPNIFTFELKLFPLPTANALDDIAGLADERVTQLRAQLVRTQQEAAHAARTELMTRLLDQLQRLGEMLVNPDSRMSPRVVERMQRLLDLAPAYNLTNDPTVSRLVADCRASLTLATETLKQNTSVRQHTAAAASVILSGHGRKIVIAPPKPAAKAA